MWKRIHSNRDPKDTLFSEIRREFRPYFSLAGNAFSGMLHRFPKLIFGLMVVMLAVSAVLSFTLFRRVPDKKVSIARKVSPISDGFDRITEVGAHIREMLALKHVVDSVSSKKQLTRADSVLLDSSLDRLQQIHQSIK